MGRRFILGFTVFVGLLPWTASIAVGQEGRQREKPQMRMVLPRLSEKSYARFTPGASFKAEFEMKDFEPKLIPDRLKFSFVRRDDAIAGEAIGPAHMVDERTVRFGCELKMPLRPGRYGPVIKPFEDYSTSVPKAKQPKFPMYLVEVVE